MRRLDELLHIYCQERIHLVCKYMDEHENQIADLYFGYQVSLHYPKKVACTVKEMMIEAEKALSAVSPLWLKELNASRIQRRSPNQLEVWKVFIQQNAPEYPNKSYITFH